MLNRFKLVSVGFVSLLLMMGFFVSQSQSFAALTIIPTGAQAIDIATGITRLPEGGQIIDTVEKLTLNAKQLELKEGEFISAERVTVEGEFGSFSSGTLFVDMVSRKLETGAVELKYKNLLINASKLVLFLDTDIAQLSGNVLSDAPNFTAEGILIDLETGDALLTSPFVFSNGPLVLKQDNIGKQLQLSPNEQEDGTLSYQASSQIEERILETFSPYMIP